MPCAPGLGAQPGEKEVKPRIAILEFELVEVKKTEGIAVEDQLRNEMVRLRQFTVVDRAQTEKLISELAFQQEGFTEADKAVQLGKLLNVQYIVTGRLTSLANAFQLNAQMIEVETAEIIRSEVVLHQGDILGLIENKVANLVARLTQVEKPAPDLQRLADEVPLPEQPPAELPKEEETSGLPWWVWVLGGLAIAGLAAAGGGGSGTVVDGGDPGTDGTGGCPAAECGSIPVAY